jgi:tRNA(fMet)-specific endonuclease VapC
VYCFDTDVLSAVLRRDPPLHLIRRLALVPAEEQSTTAITLGELVYGASKRASASLAERVRELVASLVRILPFDESAAEVYGPLRATLELAGKPIGEPDLRIASIALANDLTLVSGNVRHFSRVPDLRLENWLVAG